MTDVYVISGFLGAGKTTWIQKMLKESFQDQKVVLIENDFGQASVDAAILKHQGVEVTEINSGCICCSLAGDFVKAIGGILQRFSPDVLLIEPSGVGKLSDVVKACQDEAVQALLHLAGKITVADAARFALYMENFGEFYEDQIHEADVILFSRGIDMPDKVKKARQAVEKINSTAVVFDEAWDSMSAKDVLCCLSNSPFAGEQRSCGHSHHEGHSDHAHHDGCSCGHRHDNNAHQHDHDHDHHHHDAEEVFDSFTLLSERVFARRDIVKCFQRLECLPGGLVRAKGILHGANSNWNVQYVPQHVEITACEAPAGMMSFIGQDLDKEGISKIFQAG